MLLNQSNCNNPALWGKDLKWVIDGKLIDLMDFRVIIPNEVDFLKEIYGNFAENAKEYFKAIRD